MRSDYAIILRVKARVCWCGSMAEQLICNQQVDGSTPFTSSKSPSGALRIGGNSRVAKGGRL